MHYQQVIKSYETTMQSITPVDETMLNAQQYNDIVREYGGYGFSPTAQELKLYEASLNYDDSGMIGYIHIPKLSLYIPIYHYSSEAVLQNGVGHIESTSLPIGGLSNHSVLTGHSGLMKTKMFSEIDQLQIGDYFILHIANETLYYEVYNRIKILPYESDSLVIQEGLDLCTLITCTPYGVNTHRLLVQAKRIETPIE